MSGFHWYAKVHPTVYQVLYKGIIHEILEKVQLVLLSIYPVHLTGNLFFPMSGKAVLDEFRQLQCASDL